MLVKRCPNLSVLHLTGLAPRELGDYALTSVRYLSYDVSPGDSNYCLGLVPSSDEEEALGLRTGGFLPHLVVKTANLGNFKFPVARVLVG